MSKYVMFVMWEGTHILTNILTQTHPSKPMYKNTVSLKGIYLLALFNPTENNVIEMNGIDDTIKLI